jgi:Helix-hairpin-helix domain
LKQVKRAISVLTPDNVQVAEMLEQIAKLLEVKQADPFRVAAYRRAARSVAQAVRPLWQVLAGEGLVGIRAIDGIGPTTGAAVAEYLQTGRVAMLERLKAELPPEELFRVVPGIGSELAHRIADELQIKTLEDLELAAHDGRLSAVSGFGERRTKLVRDALAGIAPRRFNPEGKAWLPLLHTQHRGWTFTALFSNTAVAHQLGATGDWVVFFYQRGTETGQCTVVTERRGLMMGKRVVRGREAECRAFYFLRPPSSSEHSAPDGPPSAAAS